VVALLRVHGGRAPRYSPRIRHPGLLALSRPHGTVTSRHGLAYRGTSGLHTPLKGMPIVVGAIAITALLGTVLWSELTRKRRPRP
jgi:hypothetical protein